MILERPWLADFIADEPGHLFGGGSFVSAYPDDLVSVKSADSGDVGFPAFEVHRIQRELAEVAVPW